MDLRDGHKVGIEETLFNNANGRIIAWGNRCRPLQTPVQSQRKTAASVASGPKLLNYLVRRGGLEPRVRTDNK